MFERFTDQARDVVVHAQEEARRFHHEFIGTEHLLLALLHPGAGATATILADAGVTADGVRGAVQRNVGRAPSALTAEDAEVLESIGIDLQRVLARLEETLGSPAPAPTPPPRRGLLRRRRRGVHGHVPFSARAKKVLELSLRESTALKSGYIGSEHILLGLIREGRGLAALVLTQQEVDLEALRAAAVRSLRNRAA